MTTLLIHKDFTSTTFNAFVKEYPVLNNSTYLDEDVNVFAFTSLIKFYIFTNFLSLVPSKYKEYFTYLTNFIA